MHYLMPKQTRGQGPRYRGFSALSRLLGSNPARLPMRLAGAVTMGVVALGCAAQENRLWRTPPTSLRAGRTAGAPAVTDVNHDSRPDVVFPCANPDANGAGQLAVFLGDGRGGFQRSASKVALPFPGAALKLAVGDVNEDGRTDAVVGHHDSTEVAILLGDGKGGFKYDPQGRARAVDGARPHTHAVALADVNADRHLDILTTCADDNAVAVLLGNGKGAFEPAPGSPFAAGNQPYEGLDVGDVNGDGNPDIAVPNLWGSAASILLGDGTGRFEHAPGSPISLGLRPGFVALGHLNDDGALDMVVTHDDDAIVDLLLGDGRGGMRAGPGSPVRVGQPVWTAAIVDLDGDGNNDILFGGRVDRVIVLFGDGTGGPHGPSLAVRTGHRMPGYVTVADVNGDDKPDLVVAYFESDVVDVYVSG
jgi:hypothetical protein